MKTLTKHVQEAYFTMCCKTHMAIRTGLTAGITILATGLSVPTYASGQNLEAMADRASGAFDNITTVIAAAVATAGFLGVCMGFFKLWKRDRDEGPTPALKYLVIGAMAMAPMAFIAAFTTQIYGTNEAAQMQGIIGTGIM